MSVCMGEEVGVLGPEFDEDINLQPVLSGSNGTNDGAALHSVEGADGKTKIVAIPQHEHYVYRSSEMQKLDFQEFMSMIELVKQKEPNEKAEKQTKDTALGPTGNTTTRCMALVACGSVASERCLS